MKKEGVVIAVLITLIIVILLLGLLNYKNLSSKISVLEQENSNLMNEVSALNQEKSRLISERESLRADVSRINSVLSMIQEDIVKIRKGCIKENVCKGHVSGIRYKCNANGDAVDNGDGICVCDDNCDAVIQ